MKLTKVFFALLLCSAFARTSAYAQWGNGIKGEGPVVKKEISLSAIEGIGLGISGTVYLTQGSSQKIVIEAQQNIIDNIKKEVKNGSWNINYQKNVKGHDGVKIYVTLPNVKSLSIGGSGKIIGQNSFDDIDNLAISIGGSGSIELAGKAKDLNISIGGSGKVKTGNLKAENCKVSIGGSGDCYVEVSESLKASIAGSGDVYYKGRPKVNSSIAGSGRVQSME
ncbi:MAG: head GIN domain-containing protein [Saprospiraceae bacterium]|nr:head GIN domain-containing protein [Saprospiraceae bacterium]MDZ4706311.1 head GIN domain-containing protein [Saprospiraceae bacterium]